MVLLLHQPVYNISLSVYLYSMLKLKYIYNDAFYMNLISKKHIML